MDLPITWRVVSIGLGTLATGLSAYGVYEYGQASDQTGYLLIAAPFIAASAALIPILVELHWRAGHIIKALAFAVFLVPAAILVFASVAERVHYAKQTKAGQLAQSKAQVELLREAHQRSIEATKRAVANAEKATSMRRCKDHCQSKYAKLVAAAKQAEALAREAYLNSTGSKIEASSISPPAWLLPLVLDLASFLFLWSGLTPSRSKLKVKAPVKRRARRKKLVPKLPFRVISNENF